MLKIIANWLIQAIFRLKSCAIFSETDKSTGQFFIVGIELNRCLQPLAEE
jgi:hypothetical protein